MDNGWRVVRVLGRLRAVLQGCAEGGAHGYHCARGPELVRPPRCGRKKQVLLIDKGTVGCDSDGLLVLHGKLLYPWRLGVEHPRLRILLHHRVDLPILRATARLAVERHIEAHTAHLPTVTIPLVAVRLRQLHRARGHLHRPVPPPQPLLRAPRARPPRPRSGQRAGPAWPPHNGRPPQHTACARLIDIWWILRVLVPRRTWVQSREHLHIQPPQQALARVLE